MMTAAKCDIIMPTCAEIRLVKDCVESLIRHTRYPCRLIAIDNGGSGGSSSYLKDLASSGRLNMILIRPEENLGWIRSINKGLELSKDSEYVSFQNDDTVFTEGWLEELVSIFENDNSIGIANPEWEKPDYIPVDEYARALKEKNKGMAIDTDWCRGHCFVVRREVIKKLGGLDTAYIPGYYDDRDYSLKAIAAGYRCVKALGSFVYHVRNVSIDKMMDKDGIKRLMERNGKIFYKRWGYPLKIILVLKNIAAYPELLRKICMDQNKAMVITGSHEEAPYRHTNMKIIKLFSMLFNLQALLCIGFRRSRKRQKGIDFIFTNDEKFYAFANRFKRLLPAEVVYSKDLNGLSETALKMIRDKKNEDKR